MRGLGLRSMRLDAGGWKLEGRPGWREWKMRGRKKEPNPSPGKEKSGHGTERGTQRARYAVSAPGRTDGGDAEGVRSSSLRLHSRAQRRRSPRGRWRPGPSPPRRWAEDRAAPCTPPARTNARLRHQRRRDTLVWFGRVSRLSSRTQYLRGRSKNENENENEEHIVAVSSSFPGTMGVVFSVLDD
ncbi:hypothetical protein B0H17DRAFT_1132966 [Mycena rosella]|uniref:Uncharacterized protein n=1 Tax=Mycena rosella TaxID=1033263 RepID=A0AAD7DM20_MYCRO|nr:hypothetical protein B0H17DRAFT_1132966 [Mycena rosella]